MKNSPLDNFCKILKVIQSSNGISVTGIANETGMNVRTIQRHAKRMQAENLITAKPRKPSGFTYHLETRF